MAVKSRVYLKGRFETGDIPTEQDYIDLFDTYFSKADDEAVLADGSGTTANGNAVDLGGTQEEDVIIKKANQKVFKILRSDDNTGTWQELTLSDAIAELWASNPTEDWQGGVQITEEFFDNNNGGTTIYAHNIAQTLLAGISVMANGTIMVGDLANSPLGTFTKMFFKHDYTSLWDALSAAEKNRIILDFEYIGSVRQKTAATISATVLDIDFIDKHDYKTTAEVAATADFSITLSNITNAQIATIDLFVTNTVIITLPSGSIMEEDDTRWNSGSLELTIPGAAGSSLELSLNIVGSKYKWILSQIFS